MILIVNPRSGDESGLGTLTAEAQARGIGVHVLAPGDDLVELARQADTDVLGMAGGDGSLAPVAAACIERGLPFVCVPFGTRNHFARDLGLDPGDPVAALDAFAGGDERRLDVGRAGTRLFLNNVSLGAYAHLVHRREHHRHRREALARLRALGAVVKEPRPVGLSVDGVPADARVVVVANNAYALDLFSLGARERLDEGRLHLYVPSGLMRRTWHERAAERLVVAADDASPVRAAVDGEPQMLESPIEFRIEPRALRVLVPRAARGG